MPIVCFNMNTQKSNAIRETTADYDVYEYRTISQGNFFWIVNNTLSSI